MNEFEIKIRHASNILNIPNLDKEYDIIIDYIYSKTAEYGGKLFTSGVGKAGLIARMVAAKFSSTGTCTIFIHPIDAQHGDLGMIQPNDVILVFSNSGETKELLEFMDLVYNLIGTNPTISITKDRVNSIADKAFLNLFTGATKETCPLGLTPTVSTTCMSVIGDILINKMMEKIEFTKEDYYKRHHGGYLGEKSK